MSQATLLPPASSCRIPVRPRRLPRRSFALLASSAAVLAGAALFREHALSVPQSGSASATVVVSSTPTAATVLVDGTEHGRTPARLSLLPGEHRILLQHPAAIAAEASLSPRTGQTLRLDIPLWWRTPTATPLRPPFPGTTLTGATFLLNSRLAMKVTLPGNDYQLWRRDRGGQSDQLGPADAPGPLALAPDGETVAFLAPASTGGTTGNDRAPLVSVWTSGADGAAAKRRYQLPEDGDARFVDLSWAADGAHLLLISQNRLPGGVVRTHLLWLDLARGSIRPLLELPSDVVPGSLLWSPTGDHVALLTRANSLISLCLLGISPPSFRYLADLNSGDASPTPFPPLAWSPDGRQAVYAAPVEAPGRGLGNLLFGRHTANALFRTAVSDTQSVRLGNGFGGAPTWRPDGSILALVPTTEASGLAWETVDPASGRAQVQGSAGLPDGGTLGIRWDPSHRQALLARSTNSGSVAYWLLSFDQEGR